MKTLKVKELIDILQSFNPESETFVTAVSGEITDIISVENIENRIVVIKCDGNIYRHIREVEFDSGRKTLTNQIQTRIRLAQERIDSGQNAVVNQAIIDTLNSLIV